MSENKGSQETMKHVRVMDYQSTTKLTQRMFDCTDRREGKELFLTVQKLHTRRESSLRKCDEEIDNLKQILYNLKLEREGILKWFFHYLFVGWILSYKDRK